MYECPSLPLLFTCELRSYSYTFQGIRWFSFSVSMLRAPAMKVKNNTYKKNRNPYNLNNPGVASNK